MRALTRVGGFFQGSGGGLKKGNIGNLPDRKSLEPLQDKAFSDLAKSNIEVT